VALPSDIEELAAGRETTIVLTCPWHRRDAPSLAERLGVLIYVPPPNQADSNPVEGHVFSAGERLPVGVEAFPGMEPNDLVLWIESRRALVAGDTLAERGRGLEFPAEAGEVVKGVPAEEILEGLRPLLELPVESRASDARGPTDRAALERALSDARGLLKGRIDRRAPAR